MTPIERLKADRDTARAQNDPWADLCALATVSETGEPSVRTLVLRDVDDQLALFFNATSPKWGEVQRTDTIGLLVYLPTIDVQYRLRAITSRIPDTIVRSSWLLRPDAPKRMDWFYSSAAQSSPVRSREELLARFDEQPPADELAAPETALGVYLDPISVDRLDLNHANGVHDRQHYEQSAPGVWVQRTLIP